MAKHDVWFSIPERELGKADVEFAVWEDDAKLGTLRISKGAVVWIPRKGGYGYKASWSEFEDDMKTHKRFEKR